MEIKKDFKLPSEFMQKWVSALRSGEYKQTTEEAQYYAPLIDCYCVMGVGAKVNDYKFNPSGFHAHKEDVEFNATIGTRLYNILYTMNDSDKKSFNEIADWLEANVEYV